MCKRCDVAVVGGGIIGLAVARELVLRDPERRVCLLEREAAIAGHQSSHNSGVVHAGIYYEPGSLKARLCVEGAAALHELCEQAGLPHPAVGKLIVALHEHQLPALAELQRRGMLNGVPGLRLLDAQGIRRVEPHAAGIAALHSPATAIADFAAVAGVLADAIRSAGGQIDCRAEVLAVRSAPGALELEHARGTLRATHAIFCGGAWADRLAVLAGGTPEPRIVPFRGAYLRLRPPAAERVRGLIYPVPDPSAPFLGVHLTRRVLGDVLVGPTALPAAARDAYSLRRVRRRDLAELLSWPGTWRLAWRWRGALPAELRLAIGKRALAAAAARYLPGLRAEHTEAAFAGIRAQALGRDGRLIDDFVFARTGRALHVRNAPSPGATASLAIARHVVDEAAGAFGWPG